MPLATDLSWYVIFCLPSAFLALPSSFCSILLPSPASYHLFLSFLLLAQPDDQYSQYISNALGMRVQKEKEALEKESKGTENTEGEVPPNAAPIQLSNLFLNTSGRIYCS